MKRTRKLLLTFAFALLVSLLFASASMAASSTVAKIGSKKYTSLEAAVKKVKTGQTITLQKNVSSKSALSIARAGVKFTLDLNGYTLSFTGTAACLSVEEGTVTIKNGKLKNTKGANVLTIENGATVKITSGTCTGSIVNSGTLTISDGTFSYTKNNDTTLITNELWSTLTIKGGTFTTAGARLLVNEGTATISGGTFKSKIKDTSSVLICSDGMSSLTIKGGTFTSSGTILYAGTYGVTTVVSGKKTVFETTGNHPTILTESGGTVTIKNGTFKNSYSKKSANACVIGSYAAMANAVTITGGTFTGVYHVIYAANGTVFISGGTFKNTKKGILLTTINNGTVSVTGGKFTAKKGYSYYEKSGTVTIKGGSFNTKYGVYGK